MAKKKVHLVDRHMEGISAKIFELYQPIIRSQIGRQHGVYALYKGDRLYYVGLATNLKGRLGTHLKDRHHGLWDNFSVYLTTEAHHIRELELLVLRIVRPKGNRAFGRFPSSVDMTKQLIHEVKECQDAELEKLIGRRMRSTRKAAKVARAAETSLGPYVDRRIKLQGVYKGDIYKATVRADGWILYNRNLYASPTDIAREIIGRPVSGWYFWQWEKSPGKWERLKTLKR